MNSLKIFAVAFAFLCGLLPQGVFAATISLGMCTTDPMVFTMNQSMLTLATDIGTMSDRILTTETYIGTMADRIVATETLLSSTLLQLQANSSGNGGSSGGRPGELLLEPTTGSMVSRGLPPIMTLSDSATSYVLYISTTGNFQDGNVLPLLVTPQTSLQTVWQNAVQNLNASAVYIAVRSVYGQSNLSELSNAVRLVLQ